MTVAGRVRSAAPRALLPRARRLRHLPARRARIQQVVLHATTSLWSEQVLGLVAIAIVAAWCLVVVRLQRAPLLGDVVVVLALVPAGLSGGDDGSVTLRLFAVIPLRAVYGRRCELAWCGRTAR